MASPVHLDTEDVTLIRKLSWLIFIGYIFLAISTYFLILNVPFANELFHDTELIVFVNAVWFSLGIVIYGIYALVKNYRRAKLSNLNLKLDTQFLIVVAFLFFGVKQIFDLLVYLDLHQSHEIIDALVNTGKVLEFGGFMAGLFSIYLGRKRFE